jgi:hypothetical protein
MMPAADAAPIPPVDSASSPARRTTSDRVMVVVLLVAGFIYAGFLGMHMGAFPGGSDSSGYMNNARLIKFGRTHVSERVVPGLAPTDLPTFTYVPLGFTPGSRPGRIAPTYPIGLPMFIAAAAALVGWSAAAHWVIWLHALGGAALMYALGRYAGLPRGWAGIGALLLAACPVYTLFSLQLMSDVPATTWALATIVSVWLAREKIGWALVAGLALGIAVLVRNTNALLILPAAVALGADRRRWLAFVAGGLPAAVTLLIYNGLAYGSPLLSGYGGIGGLFSTHEIAQNFSHYARWLPILLTPVAVLAVGLPLLWRQNATWVALLGLWILGLFGLYSCYYHTHETWWYLRFVLPAFPAVLIAGLLVARAGLLKLGWEQRSAPGTLLPWLLGIAVTAAILLFDGSWNTKFDTINSGRGEENYAKAIEWMKTKIPADSNLIAMQASGALFFYTDFPIVRWDQIEGPDFEKIARASQATHRKIFALLQPLPGSKDDEELRAFGEKRLIGKWTKLGGVGGFNLWQYEGEAPAS